MITIERILCPVTVPVEALESDAALSYAVSLAQSFKARLFLCHCAAKPALVTLLSKGPNHDEIKQTLTASIEQYLRHQHVAKLRFEIAVVEDDKDIGKAIV